MKKVYFIAGAIIIAGVVAFFLHRERSSTLRKQDTSFAIAEAKSIDRIEIQSDNNSLILVNEKEGWKINDDLIDKDKIADLLVLAEKLEVFTPAPKSDYDNLSVKLNEGILISFYSGRKLINSFRICKWKLKIFASRIKSEKIFQVEAKGYPNVDLTKVFNPEVSHWKGNIILNFNPEEITLIQIHYPEKPVKDFKLERNKIGSFKLFDHNNSDFTDSANMKFIDIYLHFFRNFPYYSLPENETIDSSTLKEPFFVLLIESDKPSKTELYGYRRINQENKMPDLSEFNGKTGRSEPVKLQYTDFDPILLELKDFLKK